MLNVMSLPIVYGLSQGTLPISELARRFSLSQIERLTPTELRELRLTKLLFHEEKIQFDQKQNSVQQH